MGRGIEHALSEWELLQSNQETFLDNLALPSHESSSRAKLS